MKKPASKNSIMGYASLTSTENIQIGLTGHLKHRRFWTAILSNYHKKITRPFHFNCLEASSIYCETRLGKD
uniref:Uncharacterized protein n=1 Tax=Rhizophora mucronata TaxID=61149 RepID=A0A2P2P063_RHIMU